MRESTLRRWRAFVSALFRTTKLERELRDEVSDHLEHAAALHVARGLSPSDARAAARREFGNVTRVAEESRDARGTRWLHDVGRDVRFACRGLRRSPGFTTVAVLTLTLGIGANTAIFTVVNAVLLRPLAYRDASQLVVFRYGANSTTVAPGTYFDWKASAHSFSAMGAAQFWTPILGGDGRPREVPALHVSADLLPLLGVKPLLGRTPLPAEEHAGAHRVVVLRHDLWQSRFGGDSSLVGRDIQLDGQPYTVVGVMPRGFVFAPFWATHAQLWAPLVLDSRRTDRDGASTRVFARLRDGVSLQTARAEMATITGRLERAWPGTNKDVQVVPLHEMVVGDVRNALVILQVAVALVLLIACANVAHLQLLRAAARQREFAVRTALGASRRRLLRFSLIESLVLSAAGGAGGLVLAFAGVRTLVAISPPNLPRLDTIGIDASTFVFLMAIVVLTGAVFGVAPALAASRVELHAALKEGGRGASDSARKRRVRGALVGSEFAMAVVLLIAAGLVIKSFGALVAVNTGFGRDDTMLLNVSLTGSARATPPERTAFFRDLLERLRDRPGIAAVSAINHAPFRGDSWHLPFSIEGRPRARVGDGARAEFLVVYPGYFKTMGVRVALGRDFTWPDVSTNARVVVVNEFMARRHWPGANPVGQRLTLDDAAPEPVWFTVVGIVGTVHQSALRAPDEEQMYFPPVELAPAAAGRHGAAEASSVGGIFLPKSMAIVVRADGAPVAPDIEQVVHDMDRDAVVSPPFLLRDGVADQFTEPRFYLLILSAFAAAALTLAAIGIYGVISYSVARRQHEIGVRLALGAERGIVFRLIVRQGMLLAVYGGGAGLVAALVCTRYLRSLLFGIEPTDPVTFAAVIGVLAVAALAACGIPARRAARIDPVTALRCE